MAQEEMSKFEALLLAYQEAMEHGDIEKAEAIGVQCLLFAGEQAEKEPSEDLRLKEAAHDFEARADWQQAEASYRKALELAQAQQNDAFIYKAYDDLGQLYGMLGRHDEALEAAKTALEAARRADSVPLLNMALVSMAGWLLGSGDTDAALAAAQEMLAITPIDKMHDSQRARALVLRARCLVKMKDLAAAEADLDTSWRILAPQSGARTFAGIQSSLANWWATTASVRSLQRDFRGATEAMRQAVEFRRRVAQQPQLAGPYKYNSLAQMLHRYSLALLAVNNVEAAQQAAAESRAIRQSIGLGPCEANEADKR